MKLIYILISTILLTFCSSLSFAQSTSENETVEVTDSILVVDNDSFETEIPAVNLDDLEFIFTNLANDLLDNYDYLESASFNIDQELTNLDIGNIKFSIDAKTTPLEWETSQELETVEISASFQTSVSVDEETSNKVVSVNGGISLNTNVIAFLKRVSNTFGECELIPDEEIINDDDRLANLFCIALQGINKSSSVKELKPHLDLLVEKAKEIADNQEEANDALIKVLEALMINETENGLEISTIIDIDAFDIKTDVLKLTAEEDSLVLSFSGSASLPEEKFNNYLLSLNEILAEIVDYENNEDSIYYEIDSYAFIIFDVLENILVPEIIEE